MLQCLTLRIAVLRMVMAIFSLHLVIRLEAAEEISSRDELPNIVFILADDLGYGDLGCFGQKKIRTPNIDRLAAEGMRLTQHYSGNAVCAPSRCVLMTGLHPGHAFIRNNREAKPEGQFPIPANTLTLGRLLQQQGYVTGAFGKWGLGGPDSAGRPLKQGFDKFFGYNCQAVAHNFYPTSLWDDETPFPLDNPEFSAHQPKFADGVDPSDPANYTKFEGNDYSADVITEQAVRFIRRNAGKPFFLFVPTTIPHLALQVPQDSLLEYQKEFTDDPPYVGGNGYLPHRTPRAAYAAMVTRLDSHVGAIVDEIRDLGLDEQTIYIFSSDNGPLYDKLGGTDCEFFESAGPLRGRKGSLYEGGFREPTVVRWKGHIAAGTTSERVTGFEDWIPTLLELVGRSAAIPPGLDGISFAPTLSGEQQPDRPFLYREFPGYGGQVALRIGDWKGVVQGLMPQGKRPAMPWKIELYNLKEDIAESKDVAGENPEIVAKIDDLIRAQHRPSNEFPFPALDQHANRSESAPPSNPE